MRFLLKDKRVVDFEMISKLCDTFPLNDFGLYAFSSLRVRNWSFYNYRSNSVLRTCVYGAHHITLLVVVPCYKYFLSFVGDTYNQDDK